MDQVSQLESPVSVELMLVVYVFDFAMTRHEMGGSVFFEIGKNDVSMPLVLSESSGQLFILNDIRLDFVNSSFPQFLEAVEAWSEQVNEYKEETSTERRIAEFDARLLRIDPQALQEPEAFWSIVREEVEYGII